MQGQRSWEVFGGSGGESRGARAKSRLRNRRGTWLVASPPQRRLAGLLVPGWRHTDITAGPQHPATSSFVFFLGLLKTWKSEDKSSVIASSADSNLSALQGFRL